MPACYVNNVLADAEMHDYDDLVWKYPRKSSRRKKKSLQKIGMYNNTITIWQVSRLIIKLTDLTLKSTIVTNL